MSRLVLFQLARPVPVEGRAQRKVRASYSEYTVRREPLNFTRSLRHPPVQHHPDQQRKRVVCQRLVRLGNLAQVQAHDQRYRSGCYPLGRSAATRSVWMKSMPLNSDGSRRAAANAYAKQSPKFSRAGLPLPRPKSRYACLAREPRISPRRSALTSSRSDLPRIVAAGRETRPCAPEQAGPAPGRTVSQNARDQTRTPRGQTDPLHAFGVRLSVYAGRAPPASAVTPTTTTRSAATTTPG